MRPVDLDTLLTALRGAKLSVGITETLRLRELLARAEGLTPAELHKLVACVVVRSKDDEEVLGRLFRAWFEEGEAELKRDTKVATTLTKEEHAAPSPLPLPKVEPRTERRLADVVTPKAPKPSHARRAMMGAGVGLAGAGLVALVVWGLGRRAPMMEEQIAGAASAVIDTGMEDEPSDLVGEPEDATLELPVPDAGTDAASEVVNTMPDASAQDGSAQDASVTACEVEILITASSFAEPSTAKAAFPSFAARRWGAMAAALMVCLGLWLALRRRAWIPGADKKLGPAKPGPVDLPLARVELTGPVLLDTATQQDLVWGLGRYVTDRITRTLDVRATVAETTASAGIPKLRFLAAHEHWAVWLWIDDSSGDALIRRVADETQKTLVAAGLQVEIARFTAIPDKLYHEDGTALRGSEMEPKKATSVVAVLTDGRDLSIAASSRQRRAEVTAVLQSLARFPRIALIDFGEGRHKLQQLARPLGVMVLEPEQMARFLADGVEARSQGEPAPIVLEGPAKAWAAACALCPRPVDQEAAFSLRDRLKLEVTGWSMRAIASESTAPNGLIAFSPERRAELVNWLSSTSLPWGRGPEIERTLEFWRERYAESAMGEQDTLAERQRRVEQGLLDLWGDNPGQAVDVLYPLRDTEMGPAIRAAMRAYAPLPQDEEKVTSAEEKILLPWRWSELRDAGHQAMFQELGLGHVGGVRAPVTLKRPGTFGISLGLLGGVALGGMVAWAVKVEPLVLTPMVPNAVVRVTRKPIVVTAPAEESLITHSGECALKETTEQGMAFVWVCGGTFWMGSKEDDWDAYNDEKPAHRVTVHGFWMGKYEISNAEYRTRVKAHQPDEAADLPATSATWTEAKAFCEGLGSDIRLPTEAEWEYAARGPEGRKYPWGDEAPTPELAQYGSSKIAAVRVNSFKDVPSPFGTRNQAGNVWEWVEDCYFIDAYRQRVTKNIIVDPLVNSPVDCDRVLRGGSFIFDPRDLRSADRIRLPSNDRNGVSGFRCVRGVRR